MQAHVAHGAYYNRPKNIFVYAHKLKKTETPWLVVLKQTIPT
jgi:hypothetical protein